MDSQARVAELEAGLRALEESEKRLRSEAVRQAEVAGELRARPGAPPAGARPVGDALGPRSGRPGALLGIYARRAYSEMVFTFATLARRRWRARRTVTAMVGSALAFGCGRVNDDAANLRHVDGDASIAVPGPMPVDGGVPPHARGQDAGRDASRPSAADAAASIDARASAIDGAPDATGAETGGNAPIADAEPGDAPSEAATDDAAPDAPPLCGPAVAVHSPWLAGPWDCPDSTCATPAPAGADPACRVAAAPGVFVYRSRECWQAWHPGNAWGYFVTFPREVVVATCVPTSCGDRVVFDGATECGPRTELGYRYGFACESCESDCAQTAVAAILPATGSFGVTVTPNEPVFAPDGSCRTDLRTCPTPGDPPVADDCFRACTEDDECVLVETSGCDCLSGGRRAAIHRETASSWPTPSSENCDGNDVCGDCASGYGGARARCIYGRCTAACDSDPAAKDSG